MKDLRTGFRKPQELSSALMFTFASVFIFGLALSNTSTRIPEAYAAMTWVILYFASTFVFASSFHNEADRGTIGGLRSLPVSMNLVLYSKVLYCLILVTIILSTLIGSAVVFLSIRIQVSNVLALFAISILAVVGLSFLGCLTSALLIFSEGKRLLIVFLLFPISLPILIPCVSATTKIVEGFSLFDILPEIQLIVGFTIIVFIVAYLSFESLMYE